jgi:hypothetical protein
LAGLEKVLDISENRLVARSKKGDLLGNTWQWTISRRM